jgi:hypothetical protein
MLIIVRQVAAMVVQRPILTTPIEVSKIFMTNLENGQLAQHLMASLWRIFEHIPGNCSSGTSWTVIEPVEAIQKYILADHVFAISHT